LTNLTILYNNLAKKSLSFSHNLAKKSLAFSHSQKTCRYFVYFVYWKIY